MIDFFCCCKLRKREQALNGILDKILEKENPGSQKPGLQIRLY